MSLEDAKVDDYIKTTGYSNKDYRLHKVMKTTKTQVVCGGERFNKSSGRRVGGGNRGWGSHLYGSLATEQDLLIARGDIAKRTIEEALPEMTPELALMVAALIKAQTGGGQ